MDDGCKVSEMHTRVIFKSLPSLYSVICDNLCFRYAAVYLCAGLENLLEEILLHCLPSDSDVTLTATLLEHAIANNGDLWGLLQPYAHLNAGRIASGNKIILFCTLGFSYWYILMREVQEEIKTCTIFLAIKI